MAPAQPVHSKPRRGIAFRALGVWHEKLNRPKGFAGCSRVLLFLLLVLAIRTPFRVQGQEVSDRTSSTHADFPEVHDPVISGTKFHFDNNRTPTAANTGQGVFATDLRQSIILDKKCTRAPSCDESLVAQSGDHQMQPAADGDGRGADSGSAAVVSVTKVKLPDRNRDIYYRNRREFSLDVGWHPVNIPFVYDFAVGDSYNMTPLKYTLVPIIASLRWHVTNVGWRWIFRGNMDFTFSGSITPIPRGPETHYYSFDFGIRRNFVYRNWKVVPFFEQRGGAGLINAKEPVGVIWAQGQNLTFTYGMGAGLRYNIDSKYSFSAGMNYMHISNGYLSQPAFYNYGINVYGPMFGLDIRLGKPHHSASQ